MNEQTVDEPSEGTGSTPLPQAGQGPVSVLVVDDNAVVRRGLLALLEADHGVHVVGEAWDGELAVDLTSRLLPDVVLLDVRMPRRNGVSAAREISLRAKVLMLTFSDEPDVVREAFGAGAAAYLVHGEFDASDLTAAIRSVARGGGVFSPAALEALQSAPPPGDDAPPDGPRDTLGLSERQAEVMDLIAEGLSNREVASRCFLSEKTVKNHVNHILARLGVTSRAQAVSLWLRPGGAPGHVDGPEEGPRLGPRARLGGRRSP